MAGYFELKAAASGQLAFNLEAANGQAIGRSEMYPSASVMENGIASVKINAPLAAVKDPSRPDPTGDSRRFPGWRPQGSLGP